LVRSRTFIDEPKADLKKTGEQNDTIKGKRQTINAAKAYGANGY